MFCVWDKEQSSKLSPASRYRIESTFAAAYLNICTGSGNQEPNELAKFRVGEISMKALRTVLARAVWVIDQQQLNPDGRSLWDCYQALAKRYRFSEVPKHLMDLNSNSALEFKAGTFIKSKKNDLRIGLAIYNNAIVADALSSTNDAELFLQDVAEWAAKEFDLPVKDGTIRKNYISHLDVQFDFPIQIANPKLSFIKEKISKEAKSIDGKDRAFYVGSLALWTPDINTQMGMAFRLERKFDTDFGDSIYFSTSPLQTQEHLAVLADIEKALRP